MKLCYVRRRRLFLFKRRPVKFIRQYRFVLNESYEIQQVSSRIIKPLITKNCKNYVPFSHNRYTWYFLHHKIELMRKRCKNSGIFIYDKFHANTQESYYRCSSIDIWVSKCQYVVTPMCDSCG